MSKLMNYLSSFMFVVLLLATISCTEEKVQEAPEITEDSTNKVVGEKPYDCVVGEWTVNDNGNIFVLKFNEDNTGNEVTDEDQPSNSFRWEIKGEVIVMKYAETNQEWQVKFNCVLQEIIFKGLIYTKS
ncbi:hypothetical protein MASR1M45_19410 [Candidatus Kapaibacterium sp.]